MRIIPLLVVAAVVLVLGSVVYLAIRKPAIGTELRELGRDAKDGAVDAYNGTKEGAVKAVDTIDGSAK